MEERAGFLIGYAERHGPVTVRGLYYRAEVEGLPGIDKAENSYDKIQRQVLLLRRAGRLPYSAIADLTRWMRKPATFNSVEEALQQTARLYRKALWQDSDAHVEVWCEKDALAGVIYPVTSRYDVPLMVARGFSSETFCFEAVAARRGDPRPYVVYYLGDFDRAGRDATASLREKLQRFARDHGILVSFSDLAIADGNVANFDAGTGQALVGIGEVARWLPTREPKRKTKADQNWPHPFALELDAIEPDDLRNLVQFAIEQHLPDEQLRVLQIAEASEREFIQGLVGTMIGR